MRLTERVFRALRHCVLCTVPRIFIVTFIPTFQLLLSPFRVINVIPKGKTRKRTEEKGMRIETNAANRKDVVKAVSGILGEPSKYLGVRSLTSH